MERKIVHVVGTGTIGEPLIGILCEQKSNIGIDEVTFHKQKHFCYLQNERQIPFPFYKGN